MFETTGLVDLHSKRDYSVGDINSDYPHQTVTVNPAIGLAGTVILPADKSIAHRAAILSALAQGESEIIGYPDSADPQTTLQCLRDLGVEITHVEGRIRVRSQGLRSFQRPVSALDCGNSGTTMRLLSGVLAGQQFATTLVGDDSLSIRPMERVAEPLRQMGARIQTTESHAPLTIEPGKLVGIPYTLPVASAQVKSAVLLAGLFASGETTVIEKTPTRDHTERMLQLPVLDFGGSRRITVSGNHPVRARTWVVPRDFSAAAFFLVAASIIPTATVQMNAVGLNPTRIGLLDILRAMGADIRVTNERDRGGEPVGDIVVRSPADGLSGVDVGGALIPNLIDEIPVLAVAAAYARGRTTITGAAELRHKESDRLSATSGFLMAMGVAITESDDGLEIEGGQPLHGAHVDPRGDHRIAMAAAVAALGATSPTVISDPSCVGVSFPDFWQVLTEIGPGSIN
ncbi:3-phosphoshikimate 1-carboxyvinyltransferase [soil metagenome]